jgi:hypothetical protein
MVSPLIKLETHDRPREKQAAQLRAWRTLLLQIKVAAEAEAREAWGRMAQAGIDNLEARRERRRPRLRRGKKGAD